MSLNIGELVGYLGLEAGGFEKGLDGAQEKFSEFGGKLGKGATAIGAGAALALGAGLLKSMDVQATNAKLSAQLGLTAPESQRIGKLAGKLYAQNYGDSLEDVDDALAKVIQNVDGMRDASSKSVGAAAKDALNLSKVFGVDVNDSTRAVAQLLKTGLAKNATQAFDIITKGMQSGANKADDLLDTFNEYSVQFKKLGINGQTALGLIQQGLKGGARDSDLVADALKEFSIRAVDGSTTTAQGFKLIDVNAKEMAETIGKGGKSASGGLDTVLKKLRAIKDPVKRSQAAVDLFGTQAEDLGAALYKLDPSKAVAAIEKTGGAAAAMGKTLNNTASNNLATFKREISTTFVSIVGGKALPAVTNFTASLVNDLGPAANAVTGFLSRNRDIMIPLVAGLGAGVGAVLLIVGALKAWAAIQAILNAELLANPIVLVIALLAALAAGLYVAYQRSATFRAIVTESFLETKAIAGAVIGWFTGSFVPFFTHTLPAAWQTTKSAVVRAFNAVLSFLKTWGPVALAVLVPFIGIPLLIWQHWSTIKSYLSRAFSAALGFLKTWGPVALAVLVPFLGIPLLIFQHFDQIKGYLGRAFSAAYSTVKGWISSIVGAVKSIISKISALDADMKYAGAKLIDGLLHGIESAAGKTGSFVSGLASSLASAVKNEINSVLNLPLHIPRINTHIPGVGTIGGQTLIPRLARGGRVTKGGLVSINESGAEVVRLPTGSMVYPHGSVPADAGGAAIAIENYYAADQSPRDVAEQFWALTKARG